MLFFEIYEEEKIEEKGNPWINFLLETKINLLFDVNFLPQKIFL